MPKTLGEKSSGSCPTSIEESSETGVVEGGDDCLLFERRLNDWMDLRGAPSESLYDAHWRNCVRCQALVENYQSMLEATELLAGNHESVDWGDEGANESNCMLSRSTSTDLGNAKSARGRFVGWSTLLAVLFVFFGSPASGPSESNLSQYALREPSTSISMVMADIGLNEISFDSVGASFSVQQIAGFPRDLAGDFLSVNPLVQSAPASCQPFFEMPTGRLLAAGLPAVDLESVDLQSLNQIRQYWQHASRLPGIEPWQHSVNFAIGWFNQPARLALSEA